MVEHISKTTNRPMMVKGGKVNSNQISSNIVKSEGIKPKF